MLRPAYPQPRATLLHRSSSKKYNYYFGYAKAMQLSNRLGENAEWINILTQHALFKPKWLCVGGRDAIYRVSTSNA